MTTKPEVKLPEVPSDATVSAIEHYLSRGDIDMAKNLIQEYGIKCCKESGFAAWRGQAGQKNSHVEVDEAIQALAALDDSKKLVGGVHGQIVGMEPYVIRTNGFGIQCIYDAVRLLQNQAKEIAALKQSLAQPAQEPMVPKWALDSQIEICNQLRTQLESFAGKTIHDPNPATEAIKGLKAFQEAMQISIAELVEKRKDALYARPVMESTAQQPAQAAVPEGFKRQDMLDVAEALSTQYDQHINQGNISGIGDYLLETAPAYAARLIRALLNATPDSGEGPCQCVG